MMREVIQISVLFALGLGNSILAAIGARITLRFMELTNTRLKQLEDKTNGK